MPDLGKAYVQIIPSAEGISGSITKLIGGESTEAGKTAGLNIASGLKTAIAGGAVVAAGKAIFDGLKTVASEYANYEQLVGGVETLFKGSANVVKNYANNAFRTAGLSANEYMETVTSFSASLLQSLGGDTEEAAKKADQAIRDMSDNANKMGSDMQYIQNAYQSFARGQYQLLDNLKLGYGGTKEEMQRLLEDAEAISGIHYDISSYADVVDAIHVIQTEMGITGTTAKEAEGTITGSLNAVKAAWKNLLAGMGNKNADIDRLVKDFVDSVDTAMDNLMPVIDTALLAFGNILDKLGPIISERMPAFIETMTPIFVDGATAIAEGVAESLPQIVAGIYRGFDDISPVPLSPAMAFVDAIKGEMEPAAEDAAKSIRELGSDTQKELGAGAVISEKFARRQMDIANNADSAAEAIDEEAEAAKAAHKAIIDIASSAIDARYSGDDLRESYKDLSGQLDKLRESGDDAAIALAEQQLHLLNLAATNQELSESFALMGIQATGDLTKLSQYLIDADVSADEFASGVASMRDGVVNAFQTIRDENALTASEMTAVLQDNLEVQREWGNNLGNLWRSTSDSTVRAYIYQLAQWGPQYASAVAEFANGGYAELEAQAYAWADAAELSVDQYSWGIWMRQWVAENAAGDLADSALSGLDESGDAKGKGQTFGDSFTSGVSSVDGTASGSALAASSVSGLKQQQAAMKASAQLLARGAVDMIKTVAPMFNAAGVNFGAQLQRGLYSGGSAVRSAAYSVSKEAYSSAYSYAGNFWYVGYAMDSGMASGLWSGSSAVTSAAYSVAKAAYRAAASYLGIHSPSRLFRDKIGAMIPEGMAQGITQNATIVTRAMQGLAQSTVGSYKVNGAGMNARGIGAQLAPGVYGGYNITTNVTVNGAESPEDYANRLARQLQLQMRMA